MARRCVALVAGFALVAAIPVAAPDHRAGAAPVPKDAPNPDAPADLKGLHALIAKAVEAEKWPAAEDEKKIRNTLQQLLDRVVKVGELKERKLPVDFAAVEKADVAKEVKQSVRNAFVLAGDVQGTTATGSIILASGDVKFTAIRNCIVVGKNVRFTGVENSLVVAGEFLRGTAADQAGNETNGSILVAGEWLRLTGANKTVCHVLRPGMNPSPEDRGAAPSPAIRMTVAENVLFLNAAEDVQLNGNKNNTMLAPKTPIAK